MKRCAFLLGISLLFSCNKTVVFEEYIEFQDNYWHTDTTVTFNDFFLDSTENYQIILNLRHSVDYEYQNIFLFSETDFSKDTVEIYFCDKKGRWFGKGVGDIREVKIDITNINGQSIKKSKKLVFEQSMRYGAEERIEKLKHMHSIGLTIRKNYE